MSKRGGVKFGKNFSGSYPAGTHMSPGAVHALPALLRLPDGDEPLQPRWLYQDPQGSHGSEFSDQTRNAREQRHQANRQALATWQTGAPGRAVRDEQEIQVAAETKSSVTRRLPVRSTNGRRVRARPAVAERTGARNCTSGAVLREIMRLDTHFWARRAWVDFRKPSC